MIISSPRSSVIALKDSYNPEKDYEGLKEILDLDEESNEE